MMAGSAGRKEWKSDPLTSSIFANPGRTETDRAQRSSFLLLLFPSESPRWSKGWGLLEEQGGKEGRKEGRERSIRSNRIQIQPMARDGEERWRGRSQEQMAGRKEEGGERTTSVPLLNLALGPLQLARIEGVVPAWVVCLPSFDKISKAGWWQVARRECAGRGGAAGCERAQRARGDGWMDGWI